MVSATTQGVGPIRLLESKEGATVPPQGYDDAHFTAVAPPSIERRTQMGCYTATFPQTHGLEAGPVSPELESDSEWPPDTFVNVRLLARGVRWALAIEGVAAVSIYVVWYLWRRFL